MHFYNTASRRVSNTNPCRCEGAVRAICKEGRLKEALQIMDGMDHVVNPNTYLCVLHECINRKALAEGKWVHAHILRTGWRPTIFLWNKLISMYAKCGYVVDARQVFDKMPQQNEYTWSIMISAYVKHGQAIEALLLFDEMQSKALRPNETAYVSILNACARLECLAKGMQIHAHIIEMDMESNVFVASALVSMYAKCGCVPQACEVFNKLPHKDLILWNAMIEGYAKHGHANDAFKLFSELEHVGLKPNKSTLMSILKACTSVGDLEHGKMFHAYTRKYGLESDLFIGSTLIDMYTKCGSIRDARDVFNKMSTRNVVTYNVMLAGYVQHGQSEEAFKLFLQMEQESIQPDTITFLSILTACANISAVEQGKRIHACIIRNGLDLDAFVGSSLVDMYAKFGMLQEAWKAFKKLHKPDVVAWNAMISGYAKYHHGEEASKLFWQMKQEGIEPNRVTYLSILNACGGIELVDMGRQIHEMIIASGLDSDVSVHNSLVDMYAKCGCMEEAFQVFWKMHYRDVVSWNTMIAACTQNGQGREAISLFHQMGCDGMKPDKFTFVSVIKACSLLGALEQGKQIHAHVINSGLLSDLFVGNSLLDLYAKSGSLAHALLVFRGMPNRDEVSWNTIIAGYAQHGLAKEVLQLIEQMEEAGEKLDQITFAAALSVCSHAGLVDEGRHLFSYMITNHDITPIEKHFSCMVDLVARGGYLEEAEQLILNMLVVPTPIIWKALLGACRIHGNLKLAESAVKHILELEPQSSGTYPLISNIYAATRK